MATDSTELTFVRCPSCRSLVPAISTRCRMCGATIDASKNDASKQGEDSGEDVQKSGRVRQRTMTQSEGQLSGTAEKVREDIKPKVPANVTSTMESQEHSIEDKPRFIQEEVIDASADPLKDFIEEVPLEESLGGTATPTPPKESTFREAVRREPVFNGGGSHSSKVEIPRESKQGETRDAPSRNQLEAKPSEARPAIRIESGGKRFSKPSTLSFGKGAGEEKGRPGERQPEITTAPKEAQVPPSRPAQNFRPENRERERMDKEFGSREQVPQANKGAPKRDESRRVRLLGWFVSYEDPSGQGIEIREGRFFVSHSTLKENDLILPKDSISTPHALVAATVHEGVRIQDLMSEQGVFLRRKNAEAYQRVSDSVRVEHGDWIRFGAVEFLVCLLASVSGGATKGS